VVAVYIASVGQIMPRDDLPFLTTVVYTDETKYVGMYSLFGYLWVNAFFMGVTQFTISAACSIWYFTCTSDSNGKGSLSTGFYWCFRYHFGSIAFGAFLIALVQFIRIIFEYYRSQMEKANKDNKVIKILLCVTSYLLDCLERFVKFISKNAYIQVSNYIQPSFSFSYKILNHFILLCRLVSLERTSVPPLGMLSYSF
jgi:choline transporter-like protein 2/4/5